MSEQYEPKIGDLVKHKSMPKYDDPLLVVDVGSRFVITEGLRAGVLACHIIEKSHVVPFVEGS